MFHHVLSSALSTVFDLAFAILPAAPLFGVKKLSSFPGSEPAAQKRRSAKTPPLSSEKRLAFTPHIDKESIMSTMTAEKTSTNTITVKDGTTIYYKDWGKGQPVVFSHGWPLNADAWDAQMIYLGQRGYRVIAHDRRGHGRSGQTWDGNEMDTYADDLATLFEILDLKNAVMVGHSTGGGEVARYLGRHGSKRVAKAVLISAVPPIMVKSDKNPGGLPIEVFDGLRTSLLNDRSQFFKDLSTSLLRLQPAGSQNLRRSTRELLVSGHARRVQGRVRLHQGIFRDGLHGRPEKDRRSHAGHAWR